jgi:hypothetical protein
LGFTEEIRPFEVDGITLLGYDASMGNQHFEGLCCPHLQGPTVPPLDLKVRVVCSPVTQYHMAKEQNPQPHWYKILKLQLSTSTVNCLTLSALLILCCSHLDLGKGLSNCMALPTKDNTERR